MVTVAELLVHVTSDTAAFTAGMAKSEGALTSFSAGASRMGASLSRKLTLPILGVAAASVHLSNDFNDAMTMIETQAGAPVGEVQKLRQGVLDLAKDSTQGPKQLAEGLFFVESAGYRGAKALDILKLASQGATVGHAKLADTARALTAAMNTGIKGTETSTKAMGALNAIVGSGQMKMEDLIGALGTGALNTFKGLGLSVQDFGAALDVMTARGENANTASNRLNMSLLKMMPTSAQGIAMFKKLGLSQTQVVDTMRGPGGLPAGIDLLRTRFEAYAKTVGRTQAIADLTKVFPKGSVKTILELMDSSGKLGKVWEHLQKAGTDFPKAVNKAMEESANKMHVAWSSIQADLIKVGDVLAPIVARLAGGVASLVDSFGKLPGPVKMAAGGFVLLLAALGPLASLLGVIASPVGIAALAIAGLSAGVYELYQHVPAVKDAIDNFKNAVAGTGPTFAQQDAPMGVYKARLDDINQTTAEHQSVWERVKASVQAQFPGLASAIGSFVSTATTLWATFGGTITNQARAAWTAIQGIFRGATQIISGIFNAWAGLLTGDWSRLWQGITQAWTGAWTLISNAARFWTTTVMNVLRLFGTAALALLSGVWRLMTSAATAAWNGLASVARSVWGTIKGVVSGGVSAVGSKIGELVGILRAKGLAAFNALLSGMRSGWNTVTGFLSSIPGWVKGFFGGAAGWLIGAGKAVISGFISGIRSMAGGVASAFHFISGLAHLHKGPIEKDRVMLIPQGKAVIEGFIAGIMSMEGGTKTALEKHTALVKATVEAKSLWGLVKEYGRQIGYQNAIGIVTGLTQGTPSIQQQARTAMQASLTTMRQEITTGATQVGDAFGALADKALAAFDAKVAAWKNPLSTKLANMQADDQAKQVVTDLATAMGDGTSTATADQVTKISGGIAAAMATATAAISKATAENLNKVAATQQANVAAQITAASATAVQQANDAVTTAQAAYDAAVATGDAEAITKAKTDLDAAVGRQQALQLAIRTAIEQETGILAAKVDTQHTIIAAHQRTGLQKTLTVTGQELAKHPAEWTKMGTAVNKAIAAFDIRIQTSGKTWGEKFAAGIRASKGDVEAAWREVMAVVNNMTPHSPAKEGPLAYDVSESGRKWALDFARGIKEGATGAAPGVKQDMASAAVTTGFQSGGGVSTPTVEVNIVNPTFLSGDRRAVQDLARQLKPEIERTVTLR